MIRDPRALAEETFDVLIIGGGIHGACAARDAALRGLRVALIEKGDFGSQTSHNSLKIVHGGLRYLQHLDLPRVRQSLLERRFWLQQAPHSVRPLPFLIPLQGFGTRGPLALWAGLRAHELIGCDRNRGLAVDRRLPAGRLVSKKELAKHAPGANHAGATGGALWYDAQMLDADRLVLACIQDAVDNGANVCNYVGANAIDVRNGQVRGCEVVDELTHQTFSITARQVLNAAGPWAAELLGHGLNAAASIDSAHVKNMNLVVRKLGDDVAIGVKSRQRSDSVVGVSDRLFFVTPWRGLSIIGTSHVPYKGSPEACRFEEQDIAAFIAEFNDAYPGAKLTLDDVIYQYGGLTPAEDPVEGEANRSRHGAVIDHTRDGAAGLVSLVGVKFTTARLMAEKAIDALMQQRGREPTRSRSRDLPLPGAVGYKSETDLQAQLSKVTGESTAEEGRYFLETVGTELGAAMQAGQWSAEDGRDSFFRCRVRFAVRREMAVRLSDVILRRSDRLARGALSRADLDWAAEYLAEELGWTPEQRRREIDEAEAAVAERWARVASPPGGTARTANAQPR